MDFIIGFPDVPRLSLQLKTILYQHPIQKRRHFRRRSQRSVGIENGRRPYYIIAGPFAGLAAGVSQRDALLVYAAYLPVGIGLIVVVIQDLQLIPVIPFTRRR